MRPTPVTAGELLRVIVPTTPHGILALDLRNNQSQWLVKFPEQLDEFAHALASTYAQGMPEYWVKRKSEQLLEYLERKDAALLDGDLIRVENGKVLGVKTMHDVIREATKIYGKDMELFLHIMFKLGVDLRGRLLRLGKWRYSFFYHARLHSSGNAPEGL